MSLRFDYWSINLKPNLDLLFNNLICRVADSDVDPFNNSAIHPPLPVLTHAQTPKCVRSECPEPSCTATHPQATNSRRQPFNHLTATRPTRIDRSTATNTQRQTATNPQSPSLNSCPTMTNSKQHVASNLRQPTYSNLQQPTQRHQSTRINPQRLTIWLGWELVFGNEIADQQRMDAHPAQFRKREKVRGSRQSWRSRSLSRAGYIQGKERGSWRVVRGAKG